MVPFLNAQAWRAKGSKAAASAVMLERAVKKTIAALPERMAFSLLLI
jgi:hypothetical protein